MECNSNRTLCPACTRPHRTTSASGKITTRRERTFLCRICSDETTMVCNINRTLCIECRRGPDKAKRRTRKDRDYCPKCGESNLKKFGTIEVTGRRMTNCIACNACNADKQATWRDRHPEEAKRMSAESSKAYAIKYPERMVAAKKIRLGKMTLSDRRQYWRDSYHAYMDNMTPEDRKAYNRVKWEQRKKKLAQAE